MGKIAKITDSERQLLEAMLHWVEKGERDKTRIYKLTAQKLKIADSTVTSKLSRIRTKYERVMEAAREIRGWQQTFYQRTGGKFNPLSRSGK